MPFGINFSPNAIKITKINKGNKLIKICNTEIANTYVGASVVLITSRTSVLKSTIMIDEINAPIGIVKTPAIIPNAIYL
ncbi:hypothetical protein D3C79_980030 [compost metagenome]